MTVMTKPLLAQTAADLMSGPVRTIPQHMSLREAARLLAREHISGAPVVDLGGRCVGMLSATDFVRRAAEAGTPTVREPADWNCVDVEGLSEEEVGECMTADPVVVTTGTDIRSVARLML